MQKRVMGTRHKRSLSGSSCPVPVESDNNELKLGFSASGWLMMWQFGVAAAFQEAGYGGAVGNGSFVGSSGGSLVAGTLAMGLDVLKIKDFLLRCSLHCRATPHWNAFRLREYVLGCMHACTDNMMHEHPAVRSGALNISVTILPSFRNELISTFESNESVMEALLASCCMSPLAGFPFQLARSDHLENSWVFDGGLTFMHPHLGNETITVSCFYWTTADIKPSQYVPIWWALFPPKVEDLEKLFWMGFKDGQNWLKVNHSKLPVPKAIREKPIVSQYNEQDSQRLPLRTKSAPEMHDKIGIATLSNEINSIPLPLPKLFQRSTSINLTSRSQPLARQRRRSSSSSSWDSLAMEDDANGIEVDWLNRSGDRWNEIQLNQAHEASWHMSLLFKLCSVVGDVLFVLMCLVFLTPMAYFFLYCELFSRAVFSGFRAGVVTLEEKRRKTKQPNTGSLSLRSIVPDYVLGSASAAVDECKELLYSVTHPRLLLSSVPIIGHYFHHEHVFEKVEKHSLVYRILRFSRVIR